MTKPKALYIGDGPNGRTTMPADGVTQTLGILAVRGAGKTHTATVLVEEIAAAGHQVVILDPTDVWWGLRSSADGKSDGVPVYVFGGEHADFPLDASAGKLIADVVVEQHISCVISLRHLSKAKQKTFAADFAERLYERKGEGKYRTPLHLVIDEADFFAPQRIMADTARMFGAIDDIVRRGRNAGFGVTLITQRPATLNKDVLAMIEVLIVMRTIAPQDRKAIEAWIVAHDSEGHRDEFMSTVATLQRGEAWVWSPAWLDIFERTKIRQRHTFDSSATPKPGEKRVEPKRLAPVDIDALRERMKTAIEEADANDPRKLRATLAATERELAAAMRMMAERPVDPNVEVEMAGLRSECDALRGDMDTLRGALAAVASDLRARSGSSLTMAATIDDILARAPGSAFVNRVVITGPDGQKATARVYAPAVPVSSPQPRAQNGNRTREQSAGGKITGPQQKILDALAALSDFGIEEPEKATLAAMAGIPLNGNTYNNIGALNTAGLTESTRSTVRLTPAGYGLANRREIAPTIADLHAAWLERCTGPQRRILQTAIAAYPHPIMKSEVARRLQIPLNGNTYNNIGRLNTLGAIEATRDSIRAHDRLFPKTRR